MRGIVSQGNVFFLMENAGNYLRKAERAKTDADRRQNLHMCGDLCRRIHDLSDVRVSDFIH